MEIDLVKVEFDNYDVYNGKNGLYFNFSILRIVKFQGMDLLGFFYNDGTIIITLFFKEFVLRWNQ